MTRTEEATLKSLELGAYQRTIQRLHQANGHPPYKYI